MDQSTTQPPAPAVVTPAPSVTPNPLPLSPESPPKSSKKKIILIILSVLILLFILVGMGVWYFFQTFNSTIQAVGKVEEMIDSLSKGNAEKAYGMTAEELRKKISYDAFVTQTNDMATNINYSTLEYSSLDGGRCGNNEKHEAMREFLCIGYKDGKGSLILFELEKQGEIYLFTSIDTLFSPGGDLSSNFASSQSSTSTKYDWKVVTQEEKTTWKTFSDPDGAFAIRYPRDWRVKDDKLYLHPECSGCGGVPNHLYIASNKNPDKLSATAYVNKYFADYLETGAILSEDTPVFLQQYDVVVMDRIGGAGTPGPYIFIATKNAVIVAMPDGVDIETLSEVLSTLEVLD